VTRLIKLSIPHEPPYHGVARLVVGGLAARLDVSYEQLEDLQLALASVLDEDRYVRNAQVNVELEILEGALSMLVGPVDGRRLRADLDDESGERIGLGRLLGTLVEDVSVEGRPDGDWLRLEKRVHVLRSEGSRGRA
jgi:anti-sigma regulatory factor (Ser/Thr protein kinase)